MTANLDNVHDVTNIARVTADLHHEDDWLRDVTNEMEMEDGSSRPLAWGTMASRRPVTSVSKT
ncbi:hypothetical protein ABIB90_007187 [Bradyrhizobium sp. JR4.1]|uniref:hypothetical protein n=1 Tax=Bradyrhizobium sp. JR4.1 TaxID=3156372 RepID=UPI0033942812